MIYVQTMRDSTGVLIGLSGGVGAPFCSSWCATAYFQCSDPSPRITKPGSSILHTVVYRCAVLRRTRQAKPYVNIQKSRRRKGIILQKDVHTRRRGQSLRHHVSAAHRTYTYLDIYFVCLALSNLCRVLRQNPLWGSLDVC